RPATDDHVRIACCLVFLSHGLVFFFQAEDGIRDATVTGVQTCALPISSANIIGPASKWSPDESGFYFNQKQEVRPGMAATEKYRSEERRVGKERRGGRSRCKRKKTEKIDAAERK